MPHPLFGIDLGFSYNEIQPYNMTACIYMFHQCKFCPFHVGYMYTKLYEIRLSRVLAMSSDCTACSCFVFKTLTSADLLANKAMYM